jgi:hypothetical protein
VNGTIGADDPMHRARLPKTHLLSRSDSGPCITDEGVVRRWVVSSAAASAAADYLLVSHVPNSDGRSHRRSARELCSRCWRTLMPKAFEHGGKTVGLVTVLGFVVATTLSHLA